MVSSASADRHDATVYPVDEKMGEDILQRWMAELLRPLIARWLADRDVLAFTGADQFIYYTQGDPTARVSPDVYVLPGVDPSRHVRAWKLWDEPISPRFALEIVSVDRRKDYEKSPVRHDAAGTEELVVFDPWADRRRPRDTGVRWQVFRRPLGGRLVRVETSHGDRVRSSGLDCWLRVVGDSLEQRLRLAVGPTGDTLFPTADEAERAAKEAALARIAELEAELRRRDAR